MFQKFPIYSCVKSIFTKMILKQVIVMQRGNAKLGKSAEGNPKHCQPCVLILLSTYQYSLSQIARHSLPLVSESRKVNDKNEMEKKKRKEEEGNLICSIEELYSKLKCQKELSNLVIRKNPDWITVTSLTDTEEPRVNFSITVFKSLKHKIRKGHLHVTKLPSPLPETVASYSGMHKLLAYISDNVNPNSDNERIDNILQQLTKIKIIK